MITSAIIRPMASFLRLVGLLLLVPFFLPLCHCFRPTTRSTQSSLLVRRRDKNDVITTLQYTPNFAPVWLSMSNNNYDINDDDDDETFQARLQDPKFLERNKHWVVLVDDEEAIRTAVGDFLYDSGYQVTACVDADAAWELLSSTGSGAVVPPPAAAVTTIRTINDSNSENGNDDKELQGELQEQQRLPASTSTTIPSAIISDIRMTPGTPDGIELLKWIRSSNMNDRLRSVPVILLTAKAMTQDRIVGFQAGADAYLPKPFHPDELLSILDNCILRRRQMVSEQGRLLELKQEMADIKTLLKKQQQQQSTTAAASLQQPKQLFKKQYERRRQEQQQQTFKSSRRSSLDESTNSNEATKKTIFLTSSEREVLDLLSIGYTNSEIAVERGVSVTSVNRTMQKLYAATQTKTRTELVRWALQNGYVPKQ